MPNSTAEAGEEIMISSLGCQTMKFNKEEYLHNHTGNAPERTREGTVTEPAKEPS